MPKKRSLSRALDAKCTKADREVREQFGHCMARTWNRGWGGACCHLRPSAEVDFCAKHIKSWKTHGRIDGLPPIFKQEEMLKRQRILQSKGESAPPPETRGFLLLLGKDDSMIAGDTNADLTYAALASRQVPAKKRRLKTTQSVESASVLSKAACESATSQQCRRRCTYKQPGDNMASLASQMVIRGTCTGPSDGGKQISQHRRRRCGKQADDSAKHLANIDRAYCTHCGVASSGVETVVVELNVNLHTFRTPITQDEQKPAELTNDNIVIAALPSAESTQVCVERGLAWNELFQRPRILDQPVSSSTVRLSAPAASADRQLAVDGHANDTVLAARGNFSESHCRAAKAVSSVDNSGCQAFASGDASSLPARHSSISGSDFCKDVCDDAFDTNLRAPQREHGHEIGREAPLTPPPPSTDDASFCHGSDVGDLCADIGTESADRRDERCSIGVVGTCTADSTHIVCIEGVIAESNAAATRNHVLESKTAVVGVNNDESIGAVLADTDVPEGISRSGFADLNPASVEDCTGETCSASDQRIVIMDSDNSIAVATAIDGSNESAGLAATPVVIGDGDGGGIRTSEDADRGESAIGEDASTFGQLSEQRAFGESSVGCQPVAVSECVSAGCSIAVGMTCPDISTYTSRTTVDEGSFNGAARQSANEMKCAVVKNYSESASTVAMDDAAGEGDNAHTVSEVISEGAQGCTNRALISTGSFTDTRRALLGNQVDEKCTSAGQRIVMDVDNSIAVAGTDHCNDGLNRVAKTFVQGHSGSNESAANDDADGGEFATSRVRIGGSAIQASATGVISVAVDGEVGSKDDPGIDID
eukprot:TRINITY_DN10468_c0_g1_i4.p1 TRINITY_DN10468_c0_g1~~TRINITY_DN10468_c0_g1_i4.p1  ORF type:complete len:851 (+),score=149.25 TRINITY_DN10468_c0_g1_i4:80-2554(+)